MGSYPSSSDSSLAIKQLSIFIRDHIQMSLLPYMPEQQHSPSTEMFSSRPGPTRVFRSSSFATLSSAVSSVLPPTLFLFTWVTGHVEENQAANAETAHVEARMHHFHMLNRTNVTILNPPAYMLLDTNSCCRRQCDSIWLEEWHRQNHSWPLHTSLEQEFPLH